LLLYIVDDTWRNLAWTAGGSGLGTTWTHSHTSDAHGDLGPMNWWLDEGVIALWWAGKTHFDQLEHLGVVPAFYSTYHANVPVPAYNRFINGLFSSALGAASVNIYCYADWTADPWDEQAPRAGDSAKDVNWQFHSSYGLVQPSWDPMLYDCTAWESVREGIEDSRLLRTLKEEIALHAGSATAASAQAYLDQIYALPSTQYWRYEVYRKSEPIERYADTTDLILTDLSGNATNYGIFDNIRAMLISHIQQLQQEPPTSTSTTPTSKAATSDSDDDDKTDMGVVISPVCVTIGALLAAILAEESML